MKTVILYNNFSRSDLAQPGTSVYVEYMHNLAHIRNSMFLGQLYGNRCGIFSQGHSAMIPCTNCCCR